MERYLYSELSSLTQARLNCQSKGNTEWFDRHEDRIEALVKEYMPSGSGFDHGTRLDMDKSHADKLVFTTAFHHMNESGMYDGWTEHTVVVTPSMQHGFNLRISGRNRNDIKEYMYSTFRDALSFDVGKAELEIKLKAAGITPGDCYADMKTTDSNEVKA